MAYRALDPLVRRSPIIFDADIGASTIQELRRLEHLEIGGLILGPLVSDEVIDSLRNTVKKYEVTIDRETVKLLYPSRGIPLRDVNRVSDLVKYAKEEVGIELVALRLSAIKYSDWMKLLQLVPESVDFVELDFSIPYLISNEKHNFSRLLYEIVYDATSMSSKPVAIRLPLFMPELQELLKKLATLNVIFVSISSAYLCYKTLSINEEVVVCKAFCKDSSFNDLALSLTKPWAIQDVNIVLSIETLNEEFLLKSLSMGVKAFELGFSTFILDIPKFLTRVKEVKSKTVVEVPEILTKGTMVLILTERCDTCNGKYLCVKVCPEGILTVGEEGLPKTLGNCTGCNLCVSLCPKSAIRLALELKVE